MKCVGRQRRVFACACHMRELVQVTLKSCFQLCMLKRCKDVGVLGWAPDRGARARLSASASILRVQQSTLRPARAPTAALGVGDFVLLYVARILLLPVPAHEALITGVLGPRYVFL